MSSFAKLGAVAVLAWLCLLGDASARDHHWWRGGRHHDGDVQRLTPEEVEAAWKRLLALVICGGGVGGCLYLVPSALALVRRHQNFWLIVLLNLLLGWTGVGWLAALVWACTAARPPELLLADEVVAEA